MTIASSSTRHTFGRDDDRISVFSSRGPTWHGGSAKPGVAAPGQSLVSVIWSGDPTWGQHIVRRTSDPGWGSHIVWGNEFTGTTGGQHIVWRTTVGPDGTVCDVAPIANNNGSPPGRRLGRP
jgi:hypothetical protein